MEKRSLANIEQLTGLIATLDAQEKIKKDYVASSGHLIFYEGNLRLVTGKKKDFVEYTPTKHFHSQMSEKLGIPGGYYQKMLNDATKLLDENVNHWLTTESKNFLVRTFERGAEGYNTARALLSDSYSIIDNNQILMEALDSIKKTGVRIEVVNAELSDSRMYLKVIAPDIEIDAKELLKNYRFSLEVGSGIISGFALQNSEVGAGAFKITPRGVFLGCKNGALNVDDALKTIHLGAKMDELGFNKNPEVMKANLKLIREQIKHAVKIFLSKEYLKRLVNKFMELGDVKIEAPVDKVIEVVGKKYSISEERRANILKYFIEGGDTRRMGISSAMTLECQGLDSPDLKHETEVASYEVLKNFNAIEAAAMKLKNSKN